MAAKDHRVWASGNMNSGSCTAINLAHMGGSFKEQYGQLQGRCSAW